MSDPTSRQGGRACAMCFALCHHMLICDMCRTSLAATVPMVAPVDTPCQLCCWPITAGEEQTVCMLWGDPTLHPICSRCREELPG